MNDELKFLDIIRKTLLTQDDLSFLLQNTEEPAPPKNSNIPRKHTHDLFEMRILFALNADSTVDYSRICGLRLTPPHQPHEGLVSCDLIRHLTLRIGADEIYYIRGQNNIISIALTSDMSVPGVSYPELAAALACTQQNSIGDPEHTRILIALLLSTLRQLLAAGKNVTLSPAEVIAQCIRENYYRSDLSIREIASLTHFSPNYIQKVFRSGWNCTPIEYLNTVRLNSARQLLRLHRWQIKEVATMCGWNYVHYFCRRYKERFGHLPGEEQ